MSAPTDLPDSELLALLTSIPLSEMRSDPFIERDSVAMRDELQAAKRRRADVITFALGRKANLESERAAAAELARVEAADPRTTLTAPVVPSSNTDLVLLNAAGVLRTGSDDFRRDGKRHRYGPHGLPVACLPAGDLPDRTSPFPASQFDDLIGLFETAERAKERNLPRSIHDSPPVEWALGIIENCVDTRTHGALKRWYAFAAKSDLQGRYALADRIERLLSRLGYRHVIIDEHAEIMRRG